MKQLRNINIVIIRISKIIEKIIIAAILAKINAVKSAPNINPKDKVNKETKKQRTFLEHQQNILVVIDFFSQYINAPPFSFLAISYELLKKRQIYFNQFIVYL